MEQSVTETKILDFGVGRPLLPDLLAVVPESTHFIFLGYSLLPDPTAVTGPSNSRPRLDQTRHRYVRAFFAKDPTL